MELDSSISEIKGIGAKTEQLFHKVGVYTVGDILLHFPQKKKKKYNIVERSVNYISIVILNDTKSP